MGDVRDWGAFIRGRWDWSKHGYEKGFPRGCEFSDLDATVEFDGQRLIIEAKRHDGTGACDYPAAGQLALLRDEVRLGKVVMILYGCGACNNPQAVRILGTSRPEDRWEDWRPFPIEERRRRLKYEIDFALGLVGEVDPGLREVIWPEVRKAPPETAGGVA